MIPLTLDVVAAATGGRLHDQGDEGGAGQVLVDAVATDSRSMPAGSPLFVALPGASVDGHRFVGAAVEAGARALLVERVPQTVDVPTVVVDDTWAAIRGLAGAVRDRSTATAVAITGSLGKTTVKDLTAAAVGAERRVHASQGSFNNELGVPLTVLGLGTDDEVLIAEVGARHEGDIAALAPLVAPDVAVVTAVEAVHLEIFGTVEAIARAKGELVASLGPGGTAVLNVDDPRVAAMGEAAPRVVTVALEDDTADVHPEDIRLDRWARPSAVAVTPWGRTELHLPVAGRHQLLNGLLALAVAGHLGVDVHAAAAAIGAASVSRWRGEVLDLDGVLVLDDAYNANPAAMGAALQTLVAVERTGATIAVLGEMGEIGPTAADEHRRVGERCAALGVDRVVAVGEVAAAIAAGARDAGIAHVVEVADPAAAVDVVVDVVAAGDVVLVKASRSAGLDAVAASLRTRLGGAAVDRPVGPGEVGP